MGVKVRERDKGSGVWWIYIDYKGKRRARKFGRDKRKALETAKQIEAKLVLGDFGLLNAKEPHTLFSDYASIWLDGYVKTALKTSTYRGYKSIMKKHLLPAFGQREIANITKPEVKSFFFEKIKAGVSINRVKRIKATLSGIFSQAVEDGIVAANPASKLDKILRAKDQNLHNEINPYAASELETYLYTIKEKFPEYFPLFLTLARTGMRLGEALGLQWGDIDFRGNFIEIRRALVEGNLTTTKTGKTRRVDGSPQLMETLKVLRHRRKEQALGHGWGKIPEWIFINKDGKPIDQGNLRGRVHYKACEKANLRRIRIHDIRHSYATIRISAGHNIADVSRQLGHASIKITVDTYYHWLPNQNSSEVSELDDLGKERNHPQPIRNQNKKGISAKAITP